MLTALSVLIISLAANTLQSVAPPGDVAPESVICQVQAMHEPEQRFGQTRQLVLGVHDTMLAQGFRVSFDDEVSQDWGLTIDATVAYFVGHHISLGSQIGYSHARTAITVPALNTVRAGPQVGYHIPLSAHVSVYPTLSLLYGYQSDRNAGQKATHRLHSADVALDMAFVVALREHLSLSVGPFIKQSLYAHRPASLFRDGSAVLEASVIQTFYGLRVGLLGWL